MQLTHTNKTKGSHKPVMAHQIFYHQNMHNCYKLDKNNYCHTQGFQYLSSVPVLHCLQVVLFIKT